jgi:hypothetical protein
MNIPPYTPSILPSLPDFWTARHSLDRTKKDLKELGEIICDHGFHEHIGIALLHRHFYILPNERLIKYFVGKNAYIMPHAQPINDNVIPYLWKFDRNLATGIGSFYPLEFVDPTQGASKCRADAQKFVGSEPFRAEFSARLCALGLENIFGPSTLHANGNLAPSDGEILLETTDLSNRVLTLAPAAKTSIETTETSWKFVLVENGASTTNCRIQCVSHCDVHSEASL